MSDIWFTSDTHYHHKRINEYAKRPFGSVEEMHEAFIENWNKVVRPGDRVFHLGDFSFGKPKDAVLIAKRLQGQKGILWGNHDKQLRDDTEFKDCWNNHGDLRVIDIGEQSITLCHYAMRVWPRSHHGAWNLFGHSHGTLSLQPGLKQLDVGVDCWNYTPVSFEQVKERMALLDYEPQDRHGS